MLMVVDHLSVVLANIGNICSHLSRSHQSTTAKNNFPLTDIASHGPDVLTHLDILQMFWI